LAADIAEALLPVFDSPFVLFGHSMGATVAFELARHLRRANKILLAHLFVSACSSPHFPRQEPIFYEFPDPEFIEELRRLSGTPDEVLEHPELMQLMLPMLRADFEAVQTYSYVAEYLAR
jgi:medium-chain acyl-[acyl-carrier-protein] hydrolase